MKKAFSFFKGNTLGDLLKHLAISVGTLLFIVLAYFYVYLPNSTNHGDSITVPDLTGLPSKRIDSLLMLHNLRFEVSDSTYSDDYDPLDVIRQFPHAGSAVKPGRKIFVTVNRINPPTVPLPILDNGDVSLINAIATLKSNELRPGRIFYQPSPFSDLVLEMQIGGSKVEPGLRVPKGAIIDLVVGDGAGPNDMVATSVVGFSLREAEALLSAYNLHRGNLTYPNDVDTTGIVLIVLKQKPLPGDSVRVGDPINLWLGPKDYVFKDSVDIEIQ